MTDREAMKMALKALEVATTPLAADRQEVLKAQQALRQALAQPEQVSGDTSDGYHTFNELYDFRKAYNAALFNEWAASGKYSVHKSKRHYDGEYCFGGGWFIVVAKLPDGLISNHYEMKDWDKFQLPEADKALFEYDNHTGADVLHRLFSLQPFAQPEQDHLSDAMSVLADVNADLIAEAKLAQPEQEPVGWFDWDAKQELWVQVYPNTHGQPLYTAPPSKPWVSLTDEEIPTFDYATPQFIAEKKFARAIEAKLKEKNT